MKLLPPVTDKDGITWYPVLHALGGICYSFTEESQRIWQELADKQRERLDRMLNGEAYDKA